MWSIIATLFIGAHVFTYTVLRSVRGIIISESFWTKTQKQTVTSILNYTITPSDDHLDDYYNGVDKLSVFENIRLELSKRRPDWELAREMLQEINGGQHTPQIIYFFNVGKSFRVSKDVLALWAEIDDYILELKRTCDELIVAVNQDEDPEPYIDRIDEIDRKISDISSEFTLRIDRSVDILETSLLITTLTFSVILIILGFTINRLIRQRIYLTREAYRFFIEDFPAVYLVLDEMLNIISISPFAYENLGVQKRDLIGLPVQKIFEAEEKSTLLKHARAAIRYPDRTRSFRTQLTLINGENIWVQGSIKGVKRHDGAVNVLIMLQDITAKEQETSDRLRFLSAIELSSNEIYIYDPENLRFIYANQGAIRHLGYSRSDFSDLTPLDIKPDLSTEDFRAELQKLKDGEIQELVWETIHQKNNGETYPVQEIIQYIDQDKNPVFISIVTDISSQKKVEMELRKLYQEQRTLLRETNHRIKNNLHLVATLIEMQAKTTENTQVERALTETVNRLHSLMLLHDQLYIAQGLTELSFSEYIKNLVGSLKASFDVKDVQFSISVPDINMSSFAAIHCGLIVNELVTNSLKYAFPSSFSGKKKISISMEILSDDFFNLVVKDNGVGIEKDNLKTDANERLGFKLLNMLSKQLSGNISVDSAKGTTFTITFTDNVISET